jgi:hypothetical protein
MTQINSTDHKQRPEFETRSFEVRLNSEAWNRIERLITHLPYEVDTNQFVTDLLDHVQQAVYRSGSWEREAFRPMFGDEALDAAWMDDSDPL